MRVIETLGAASCIAGSAEGCCRGPQALRRSGMVGALARRHEVLLRWRRILEPRPGLNTEAAVADLCGRIRRQVRKRVVAGEPFLFMGGDHSCAMGVWSGAMRGLNRRRDLGLVWVDAHMDAHTFRTTPSENIHGMPLAALLGRTDPRLARIYGRNPTLDPAHLVLIGVRSFEAGEQRLLRELGVRVRTMDDIRRAGGLRPLLAKEIGRLKRRCRYYGVSLDLDAVDPTEAPGVSTPAPKGLAGTALCRGLAGMGSDPALLGLEIAEFNPLFDQVHRTARLVEQIIGAVYGGPCRQVAIKAPKRSFGSAGSGINFVSSPMSFSLARS